MNDQPEVKVETRRGFEFAEMAEALGIRTTQIMAAHFGGETTPIIVFYTPELDEDDLDPGTPIFGARLARDEDRILTVVGEPVMMEMDWSDMQASIERRLEEMGYGDA